MANRTFDNVQLTVKWRPTTGDDRPNLYPETGQDDQGYLVENLAIKIGQFGRWLTDLRGAAFKEVETSSSNFTDVNTTLPTAAAVKGFVEGKGYVTSSGVTSITPGDGLVNGSGNNTAITSSGTMKASLKDYTKASVGVLALTNPTANTKFYPISLDKDGKLGVNVPWTDTNTKVTSAANHYTPTKDDTATESTSVDASSSTAATWGTTALVTGVNIERDAKGHVTGLTLDSIKMPSNPNTNTTYTFAEGTTNGAFSVTPSGGSAQPVPIHGLGSAAYTASTAYAAASHNHSASNITSGTLGVARGGTGATTFTSGEVLVGAGTSAVTTKAIDTTVTADSNNLITSGAVKSAINALPTPMVFRGTVGSSGATVTTLATDGSASIGDTYKVITAGTYGGKAVKVGDTLVCITKTASANTWEMIPSGDDVEDTWRNIKVNGTEKLGTGISTGGVDFVNGTNTTVSFNATGNKLSINASHPTVAKSDDTTSSPATLTHGGTFTAVTAATRDSNGHVTTLNTTTYTLPAQYISEIASSGAGNAITGLAVSNGKLTYTKGSTFLTAHPTITAGTDTIPTATLTYGGTFGAITGVTKDSNGHVKALATTTFTMPAQYTHPTYTSKTSGLYKITVDDTGHVSGTTAVTASDIKSLSSIKMTAASSSAAGTHGMVPVPGAGDQNKFLRGDATWATPTDTKVNVTLATTTKAYLLGVSTTPTSTANALTTVSDTGVYLDTTAGRLHATSMATSTGNVVCDGDTLTINCVPPTA